MYFIIEGKALIFFNKDDTEKGIILKKNDFFGENGIIDMKASVRGAFTKA